jgi:hypothetical protein
MKKFECVLVSTFCEAISRYKSSFVSMLFALTLIFSAGISSANDTALFIQNNPDGGKYEFVRHYLQSLNYLFLNESRESKMTLFAGKSDGDQSKLYLQELNRDNVNLRVARNILKKYFSSPNPLMVKTVDLFYSVCGEQIDLNNEEIALIEKGAPIKEINPLTILKGEQSAGLLPRQEEIALKRKESLKTLLEASMLINKILISNQLDQDGELVALGITGTERRQLLQRLNDFPVEKTVNQVEQGQSFLQASVASIRGMLEDKSWGTIEDLQK